MSGDLRVTRSRQSGPIRHVCRTAPAAMSPCDPACSGDRPCGRHHRHSDPLLSRAAFDEICQTPWPKPSRAPSTRRASTSRPPPMRRWKKERWPRHLRQSAFTNPAPVRSAFAAPSTPILASVHAHLAVRHCGRQAPDRNGGVFSHHIEGFGNRVSRSQHLRKISRPILRFRLNGVYSLMKIRLRSARLVLVCVGLEDMDAVVLPM